MFHYFELTAYPRIYRNYSVTRNTTWGITEPEHLLIFIEEGFCQFSCAGETRIVNKGDIVYIPENQPYVRKSIDNTFCTMTYVHFLTTDTVTKTSAHSMTQHALNQKKLLDNYIFSGDTRSISGQPFYVYLQTFLTSTFNESIQEQLDMIFSLSTKRQLTTNLQISIALCNVLMQLSQKITEYAISNTQFHDISEIPPKLKRAISYITMHYSEPITLEALSAHCNVSKQQLIRYFNNAFHTTPINYITDFKLSRAKELLFYHPEISIKEIAAELGFDNQHYFSRVFMKKNGETPSQYRDRTINFNEPDLERPQNK